MRSTPEIDENAIADVRYMAEKGYVVQATTRQFNPARDYLWPIPASDRLINENLTQNPGY
ncbi:MAG: RagB/SusD family nutrient uptake outer membrane protein [Bacteroidales bacterium]|nr:RagB/SusD family nutrient uptake outer membrane protein [Bacteroidales bacterium]